MVSAAAATPAPNTTETPRPAARTDARVRSRDVREERGVTRWDIENLMGRGTEKTTRRAEALPNGLSLGNPRPHKCPKR
ncbi:hypothetical protein GCM10027074_68330 [Streptomyces deserti]